MGSAGSLGGDVVKLTGMRVLSAAISLITAMLLSRFSTLEEYGTYSEILLVANLASSIFMLGLPNSVNFFLGKAIDDRERRDFLAVYYLLSTTLGALSGLVLVLSLPLIESYFGNANISSFWYLVATLPWANIILSGIDNVLVASRKANTLLAFKVPYSLALLGAVLLAEVFGLGFNGYMALFAGVQVIFGLGVYAIVPRVAGALKLRLNLGAMRTVLAYSIPLGLASSTGLITVQFDKLLIGISHSVEEMAVYTNASREMPVSLVAASLTAVVMPVIVRLLSRGQVYDSVRLWGRATLLGFGAISFVALGLFVFAEDALTLLYSEKYTAGATVFRVYALVLFFRATYFAMFLSATGRTRTVLWTSLLTLGMSITLGLAGLWLLGFPGPALGSLTAIGLTQLIQLILTSRTMNIPFRHIFPWRALGGITALNVTLGLFAYLAKLLLPLESSIGSVAESLILGTAWLAVYAGLMARPAGRWLRELRDPGEAPAAGGP